MLLGHSKLTTNCDNLLFLRLKVNCILISPIILLKILMICSGYIAPEYLYRGEISTKSDIYSLGLLIMETTTGEKNCPGKEPSAVQFIKNVRENWKEQRIASEYPLLDVDGLQQVKKCIEIGLECVEIDRLKRPSIETILDKLNGRCASIRN
ncbi:unnamed protein product [Triticum turgidum subsp. durum]|uniref:Protein kinase domain-containing protein n=1 Tax=Triticum turgidum subsp. durum TaxID=4567 RepID=A0A9R0SFN4_TRITD|nr:unnamed protein product [Triticum turgidum subsp. durum]